MKKVSGDRDETKSGDERKPNNDKRVNHRGEDQNGRDQVRGFSKNIKFLDSYIGGKLREIILGEIEVYFRKCI